MTDKPTISAEHIDRYKSIAEALVIKHPDRLEAAVPALSRVGFYDLSREAKAGFIEGLLTATDATIGARQREDLLDEESDRLKAIAALIGAAWISLNNETSN